MLERDYMLSSPDSLMWVGSELFGTESLAPSAQVQ